ncbi:LysR family transcriptional regulator [Psychrobium sp. MM17-31]|uniref:LysR family transcriptional regulator n=1 Tax=Psychrobium sp. MM17-31 TaxID=2917758 RepID=UPI001EF6F5C1|nr:LysR family transcriptional regulator [Psychrobium sp. MM17-31]MCG7529913.1 LysR family transcriptional regulator [Psychrobium sp. MM17-31]
MTLEQLKALQKVVELGTIQAAADALHKTQPALSMAIKKLEQQYGFALLDRSKYRLTLTPQGKVFYRQAKSLLLGAEQLESVGKHLAQGHEAVFRVGYDPLCDSQFIIDILAKFQTQFPTTSFELIAGSRFSSLEQLNNDEVDITFGAWFHLFHGIGDYLTLPVEEFEIVVVAAPSYLKDKTIERITDLYHHPSVTLIESNFSFDSEQLGAHSAKPLIKTRDAQTLKAMLVAGMGIGFVPKSRIKHELLNGQLQQIALADFEKSLIGEIRAIIKEDKVLGPVGQQFWQEIKKLSNS